MNEVITTIREWIESVLGTYTPVTYTEKVVAASTDGIIRTESFTKVAEGVAGLDWGYICTAVLLFVVIYSTCRLVGILLQSICGRGTSKWW